MSAETESLRESSIQEPSLREHWEQFSSRHVGPDDSALSEMLALIEVDSLDQLAAKVVPPSIRIDRALNLPVALTEHEVLAELRTILSSNRVARSYIGMGYADTFTPSVILRNVLENPGWYTQYTPYQAEISQGRLEALINFQTMVSDLTGLPIANASLLDEGTAAAEAMTLAFRTKGGDKKTLFVISSSCHPQTIDVVRTRAEPLGISVVVGDVSKEINDTCFGILLQYPTTDGLIEDYRNVTDSAHSSDALCIVAADLLALALLLPPGEWGADIVVGNTQRFGVPLGFGGPHAAFFAARAEFSRQLPGRLVGVSKDSSGRPAFRLAIQVREQHIKRERATSNICTAQVLLAVMASLYAVYHGPHGIRRIAERVHLLTNALAAGLLGKNGVKIRHRHFFDTLRIDVTDKDGVLCRAEAAGINLRVFDDESVGVTLDEVTLPEDLSTLLKVLDPASAGSFSVEHLHSKQDAIPMELRRTSPYLAHPVFNTHHSETELLRYVHLLQSKDLSLTTSMIPLGSCTMKLNATSEMIPVTWPEIARLHPFAPESQTAGIRRVITDLEQMLGEITGLPAVSLQPNAGSQGEYAGLLLIRAYHRARGDMHRKVVLIPESAHGTNPASAILAGLEVVVVRCDAKGNVDLGSLREKATEHGKNLAAIMITYPSTHGVFEEGIRHICDTIHANGGLVYMDGANLNAQVGLCRPGDFGVDVCHLNLHKTFCIPHGGGGPGIGPIAARAELAQYLPQAPDLKDWSVGSKHARAQNTVGPVTSAPWGSAGILVIPWVYIRLMGAHGLVHATKVAILNANYIAKRLEQHFPVLYSGENGFVAHECILDLRNFKRTVGIEVQDVAKRLMDYGFHAPTVSFPVVETLMVEPTESESKEELDRFCDAMIAIRNEIREIELGLADAQDNALKKAPHTASELTADSWTRAYAREKAGYPLPYLREHKFWPTVNRIDNAYGDRNLFCTCVPLSDVQSEE